MISRDFFSVANNLGDSVAFNLESDNHVEAFKGRTLTEQTLPFPKTFLHYKGRDALQVLGRKFRKQVASPK